MTLFVERKFSSQLKVRATSCADFPIPVGYRRWGSRSRRVFDRAFLREVGVWLALSRVVLLPDWVPPALCRRRRPARYTLSSAIFRGSWPSGLGNRHRTYPLDSRIGRPIFPAQRRSWSAQSSIHLCRIVATDQSAPSVVHNRAKLHQDGVIADDVH